LSTSQIDLFYHRWFDSLHDNKKTEEEERYGRKLSTPVILSLLLVSVQRNEERPQRRDRRRATSWTRQKPPLALPAVPIAAMVEIAIQSQQQMKKAARECALCGRAYCQIMISKLCGCYVSYSLRHEHACMHE
jgi:hypothetical protein